MITFPEKWKRFDKKQVGVLFLVGVLLIIIAMPTSDGGSTDKAIEEEKQGSGEIETVALVWEELTYKTLLEEELETILVNVEGVGQVQVMITLKTSTEKVVEKDVATEEAQESEETIYEESDGNQIPYVKQEVYPEIEGVVVAAQGGGSSVVVQNITEAIQALFDIDTHKIKIMKLIS